MDCHSAREMHGDGTAYESSGALGATDTTCEKCHDPTQLPQCGIDIHKGKLECAACHVRTTPSRGGYQTVSYQLGIFITQNKFVAVPLNNVAWLMNHRNQQGQEKVTLGNVINEVDEDWALTIFEAGGFSHCIMKEGRKCGDCHGTAVVQAMKAGTFTPVVWEKGRVKNATGIIPVLDGYEWDFPWLRYVSGQWAPFKKPANPMLTFRQYSRPLTQEQFNKLVVPESPKP